MRLIKTTETSKGSLTLWSNGNVWSIRLNCMPVFPHWSAYQSEQRARQLYADYVEVLG